MGIGPDREDFERRLLALVRNYMEDADEKDIFPAGFEINDFMVIYEILERVPDAKPLQPWETGPRSRAGFYSPVLAFSSTTSTYWLDEAFLAEALSRVRNDRKYYAELHDDDGGDEEDEDDTGEVDDN
jgi:hypothetical protein